MTTRTIVTSQPDLPCDVCGRRLLRGERPDVFLAGGGRRLTVCELCAPRAAHEGWRRESAHADALELGPARSRRARNLLGRLRQRREPGRALAGDPARESESLAHSAHSAQAQARPMAPAGASAQAMAEEFDPLDQLHGAAPPVAAAAPLVEAPGVGARAAAPVVAAPAEMVEELEALRAEPDQEPDQDQAQEQAAEDGSWRDAWMFVGE